MKKHFLGLVTRCKDEFFIEEFCRYYLNQGVEKIHVIDDASVDTSIYDSLLGMAEIELHFERDITRSDCMWKYYPALRQEFEWLIYVDIDEFIAPKKALCSTIRNELITTFQSATCVKVPWVMMACNGLQKNPQSVLASNVYRWNHNKRHVNTISSHPKFRCRYEEIEVKCIFKPAFFEAISSITGFDHHPLQYVGHREGIRDGVSNNIAELNPFHRDLREANISSGHLLCYHYRLISVENCRNKLETNSMYIESGHSLEELLSADYAETLDETLATRSRTFMKSSS